MPKPDPPELDTWLDQEISSLVEAVASDANGRTARRSRAREKSGSRFRGQRRRPKAFQLPGHVLSSKTVRNLGVELRLRSATLGYLVAAGVLGVLVAWLTVTFTKP
jgi:hypothetical protein